VLAFFAARLAAVAAADRHLVERHRALATALVAGAQAAAQILNHFRAALILRSAADADAVREHLATTIAAIKIATAHNHAVPRARNAARAIKHLAAQILHRGTGEFVFADAIDLAAAFALFHPQFALSNV
jgi:hypothetical protein